MFANMFIYSLTPPTTMAPKGTTELSPRKRGKIIALRDEGLSYREISTRLHVAPSTCYKTVQRDKLYNTARSLPRSGRPPVLSPRDKRSILRTLKKHRLKSYRWVGQEAGGFTESQVRKTAHAAGYHRRVARRKPFLSLTTIRKCLEWARRNLKRDWTRVIWTDETALRLGEVVTRRRVTRGPGEEFLPETVAPTFTNSKESIMLWGCIAHGKKGPLICLDLPRPGKKATGQTGGRGLDARRYVAQVLEGPLFEFYSEMCKERGGGILVVEDGAPAHKSRLAEEARSRLGIRRLDHPPNSPDLNPIEALWFELKRKVQDTPGSYKSRSALWEAAKQAWAELPESRVERETAQMDDRVKAVLKAKGRHTKY